MNQAELTIFNYLHAVKPGRITSNAMHMWIKNNCDPYAIKKKINHI